MHVVSLIADGAVVVPESEAEGRASRMRQRHFRPEQVGNPAARLIRVDVEPVWGEERGKRGERGKREMREEGTG